LALNQFFSAKEILIDDAGWGDLILGVVIGALQLPNRKYMRRRIPVSSFQPPHFENKRYLNDAVKIAEKIVKVMRPDSKTRFKVCSGYVLSNIRNYLRAQGFKVEEVEIVGELQEMVERSYIRWCIEVGVPKERLENKRRFWTLLEWVAERPELREKLVKTGWKSWKRKWRGKVFTKSQQRRGQSARFGPHTARKNDKSRAWGNAPNSERERWIMRAGFFFSVFFHSSNRRQYASSTLSSGEFPSAMYFSMKPFSSNEFLHFLTSLMFSNNIACL
jgi:hypothetical protein